MSFKLGKLLLLNALVFSLAGCSINNQDEPQPEPNPGEDVTPTKVMDGISIVQQPSKLDYVVGETFDPTGVVIKEKYNDGSLGDEIVGYTYTPTTPLTLNDNEITFRYSSFMAKQRITVSERQDEITYASSIEKYENGRVYLKVDGKPFVIRGAQLRVDGLLNRSPYLPDAPSALSYDQMEKYFIAAKEAGLNTMELCIQWSNIEPSKDVYQFGLVDALMTMLNKHGLKGEINWFSVNMCGDCFEYQIPNYIYDDTTTYPRMNQKDPFGYSNMYGNRFYLLLDHPAYQEREAKAAKALMDHIYEWNLANGKKNPIIGVQVQNETDGLVRWRYFQREIYDTDGSPITQRRLWDMTLSSLDNAGKAFKSSKYKLYTRCNITTSYDVKEYPQCPNTGISPMDIYHLEGIDIIGSDPYVTSPKTINQTVKEYRAEDNYPHIAENMGHYSNSPSLFLAAYQAGGSYMFYDLATPEYFVYMNELSGSSYQMDQGIYNPDLTFKAHSEATFNIVKGIGAMGGMLSRIESQNFAAFNIDKENPVENRTQTINTTRLSFTYETTDGGVGFAIDDGNYAYLASSKDASIAILNANYAPYADVGYFDGDEFIVTQKEYPTDKIYLSKGKLYRIKITKLLNDVISNTDDNI